MTQIINGMLGLPKRAAFTAGSGDADNPLNAFDNALCECGIENQSLIQITSILPSNIEFIDLPQFSIGSNIPVVQAKIISEKTGHTICAVVVAQRTEGDNSEPGPTLVAEFAGLKGKEEGIIEAKHRLKQMAKIRGLDLVGEIQIAACEHTVQQCGCALAFVVEVDRTDS
ncbi:MAG: pyruvoyl-dependent arginine decarboxylase [Candidatus Hodarchaeota archaeon]